MPAASSGRARRVPLGPGLAVAAVVAVLAVLLSIGVGPIRIPVGDVLQILGHRVGLSSGGSELNTSVVMDLRMPRVVFGSLVGAALAVSGAALQSLFNNPLAPGSSVSATAPRWARWSRSSSRRPRSGQVRSGS